MDVIQADGGKGVGIQKVLAYYGLDKSQALAFGDGNNDLEMLEAVGTGVAMANASPSSRRWPMQYAQAWRRTASGNTAQPMG